MTVMLVDIVKVKPLGGHRLYLRFADGLQGEIDLDRLVRWEGVLGPLSSPQRFSEVRVHPGLGTIVWPNGADLDPDVLYAAVSGRLVELKEPVR